MKPGRELEKRPTVAPGVFRILAGKPETTAWRWEMHRLPKHRQYRIPYGPLVKPR